MTERRIRITLVRHGESLANLTQRWQGQGNARLSALGEAQARAVARRLERRHFDHVVSSDLERAAATARAIAKGHREDASFREFDIGAWEGLTREEVLAQFPDELARLDAGEDVALGGGESYSSFCERVDHALARLRSQLDDGQHALVVCHGGVIGALVSGALGLRGVRELPIARVFNTSISELSYDAEGRATLHVFNDSLHLSELELYPHPTEMSDALALICERAPHPAFGGFSAHYDYELGSLAEQDFFALSRKLRADHPTGRVALCASAARIHAWARATLFRTPTREGGLREPPHGALCHVSVGEQRIALVDYGVSV